MFVNKRFTDLACAYLKKQKTSNAKSSTYFFHMKMKILADFQIYISVPLIEYSDNYSKTSGSLWQSYRHEPNKNLTDSETFKSKIN